MWPLWTIKKAKCQRIDAFELCSWRRLLESPLAARRSNQSIVKEIIPEYSLEWINSISGCWNWSSNTLATRYEELTHWKRPWCWERLKTKGEGRGGGQPRMRRLDSIIDSMDMNLGKFQEMVEDGGTWCDADHEVGKSQTWFSDWTTTTPLELKDTC